VFAELLDAGGVADQQRRAERPAPLLIQQRGPIGQDQLAQL